MGQIYAILGDIHANIDALKAVLEDARARGATRFACVGDMVGYNAAPAECISIVRDELKCPVVCGNHDRYVSSNMSLTDFHPVAATVVEWTRQQLASDDLDWLRALPMQKPVMGFTLVHSTLDMPEHWGYVFDSLQASAHFVYQKTPICFHGHTHVPIVYEECALGALCLPPENFKIPVGKKFFVNVGSVGQPRDGDPRASYVLFDTGTRELRFRRVAYDIIKAQARIRAAGLPERCAARLVTGS